MEKKTSRTVDVQAAVANNFLDETLLFEVGESLAGQAAVDLETVNKSSDGDQAVGLYILVELLGSGLVEDDGMLSLVLDYIQIISQFVVPDEVFAPIQFSYRLHRNLKCRSPALFQFSFHHPLPSSSIHEWSLSETSISSANLELRYRYRWLQRMEIIVTYPCPWTTSSFASCHRRMLLEPVRNYNKISYETSILCMYAS